MGREKAKKLPRLRSEETKAAELKADRVPVRYAGRLHPRFAAGLAPLLTLRLRAVEATDTECRLEKVEKLLAEAERRRPKTNTGLRQTVISASRLPEF